MLFQEAKKFPKDEMRSRLALSRIYYAAFHLCNTWQNSLPEGEIGQLTGQARDGSHAQLIDRLLHPNKNSSEGRDKASKALAGYLLLLRTYRETSDYQLAERLKQDWLADAADNLHLVNQSVKEGVNTPLSPT